MPDWKKVIEARIKALRLDAAAESDLADELSQHLEDHYREQRSGGAEEPEAYRSAIAELDDMQPLRAAVRRKQMLPRTDAVPVGDARAGNVLEDLGRDLRYAFRTMRKNPLFVLVVVVTLALGIGANTTVFTMINTLLLNPVPVSDPSGLAAVGLVEPGNNARASMPLPLSYPDLQDYQTRNAVFESLAGYTSPRTLTWQNGGVSERLFGELVTGNYFSTLGLRPALGRYFAEGEDSVKGARAVAVMNYGTWQLRFGGSRDILGRTLRLNKIVFTVIGVAPPQFIGINGIFGPDLWLPSGMAEQLLPGEMGTILTDRHKTAFLGIGRLKAGEGRAHADANLSTIAADLARAYPAEDEGRSVTVRPVRDVLFGSSGGGSSSIMFGGIVLLAVVGIVLLIACSNVANLLLARSAARQQEMAVRLAIGASRRRLVRQLLTESVLLGCFGGACGLAVGYAGLRLLFGTLPGAATFVSPKFDGVVFAFALVVSLATGLLFGAVPAFQSSRTGMAETLKEEARSTGGSRRRISVAGALLVGQVAFSFLLLVMAALFLRSMERAYEIDPGFQTAHLGLFMTNPGPAGYAKPQALAFYKEARERVEALPGIQSVSWSSNLPLWSRPVSGIEVEGRQARSRADRILSIVSKVDRNFFGTAGVRIEQGREFTDADQETSTPVAIVNEKMAQDYWPGGAALGSRILVPGETQMRLIVGVAGTANYTAWAEAPQHCVYVPLKQNYSDSMTMYVRTKGDPRQMMNVVQREILAAGPGITVSDMRTGRAIVDGGLFQAKMGVALLSVFGLLALGLASIALYGIMAYSVHRRKREIGLRMALGAAQPAVLRMILKQGMTLVFSGVAIGFTAALFAGRLLSRMLFGVSATDPESVAAAAAVLVLVAFTACYLPARRASRLDPLAALREG